jgi:LPS sulfotransferase NodH
MPFSGRRHLESRLVWIMGSPRSGSTWLLNLLAADSTVVKIDEPGIGAQLGVTMTAINGLRPLSVEPELARFHDLRRDNPDYFFSDQYRDTWLPLLRALILARIEAQMRATGGSLAVLKEPHGSIAADLLLDAVPNSKLIFLQRDGRDVIDSQLDAGRSDSWGGSRPGFEASDADRMSYLRERAHSWLWKTAVVSNAFSRHPELLRKRILYEDLRRRPHAVLSELAEWLNLDGGALERAADRLSFERIPEHNRGAGKFARAATPGLWKQNLAPEEQKLITEIIGPELRRLGYS